MTENKTEVVCPDCKNQYSVLKSTLRKAKNAKNYTGLCRSCYVKRPDLTGSWNKTHGESLTRLFRIWTGMRKRCVTGSCTYAHLYKGRGIKICDEWSDFQTFKKWAIKNGYKENLTIDRVDNDGDYCPENCQWLTVAEHNSKGKSIPVICVETGQEFPSAREASLSLGLFKSSVSVAIKSGHKAGGYHWVKKEILK